MQKNFTLKILLWVIPLLIIVTSPASLARHDQQILDREITIDLKDVPLGVALTEIENIAGVRFVYSPSQLDLGQIISVVAQRKKLREILNDLFGPMAIKYSVDRVKEFILLKPQKAETERSSLQGKEGESDNTYQAVTGKVTDAITQQPIAGVNIVVKGTTSGTTTDSEGEYVITAEDHDILVFSFIGYKKFETQVGGRMIIDVTLEEDVASLEEVVVNAGYYLTTDKMKTGNIAKVTAKDIERQPVTSPLMALQGRVPGLEITPRTGSPGNAPTIRVRGENSLRFDGGYPLYVINGVPIDSRPLTSNNSSLMSGGYDPLGAIDPANIESIEVLKDADATAIYGSRGANGVILITTKQAVYSQKTTFNASFSRGITDIPNRIDLLNREQYLQLRMEAFENAGATPGTFDYDINGVWDQNRETDWQDKILGGTGHVTDAQVSISGGNNLTSFRLGGNFHQEDMIFGNDFGFKRYSGFLNLSHVSNDQKFKASSSFYYGSINNRLFNDLNFINYAFSLPPNAPEVYDENGNLNWEVGPSGSSTFENPYALLRRTHESTTDNVIIDGALSYEVVNGLNVKSTFGYTYTNGSELLKSPINANNPTTSSYPLRRGSTIFGNNHRRSWIVEPQLSYDRVYEEHSLSFLVGSSFQESRLTSKRINASGYTSDALLGTLQGGPSISVPIDEATEYRYTAIFARIGYNYQNKYFVNITGRRDGSSRFGPGKQFGNFGAVGIGWIFSNEGLFRNNISFLSFGKIRTSFGTTGNDQIGDYKYYDSYSPTRNPYQGVVGLNPTELFNPEYAWEVTKKVEGALELGFFKNRIIAEVSRYKNRSSNQLVQYPLPTTTGFPSIISNFDATVENSGWEFILKSTNIKSGNFEWITSGNISINRNKLVEFDDIENSPYASQYEVGKPLSVVRLYKSLGVNPNTGVHELLDVNVDGKINNDDRLLLKGPSRDYYGGIINTLRLREVELSFLFQFVKQTGRRQYLSKPGIFRENAPVDVLDFWIQEGDKASYPFLTSSFTEYLSYSPVLSSDFLYEDASFVRLKTLSLSYRLSENLIHKSGVPIQSASIYVQGQNLLTLTNFNELDPETGRSNPPLRMFIVGIELKF